MTLFMLLLPIGCGRSGEPRPASAEARPGKAADASSRATPAPPETIVVVRFAPGPAWVAGKPAHEQPGIGAHVENMKAWAKEGRLRIGGPFLDSTGGMALLDKTSVDEAKALAAADPGVVSGLLVAEVHPWLVAMTR
jgi:uncharacterized protein YciI